MTWEEAILFIRNKPEWQPVVDACYFDEDLKKNVERFKSGDEFKETLRILKSHITKSVPRLLDVGAGNGIAALSFALEGFDVVALEPDPSGTIGSGAIQWLKEYYKLDNLKVVTTWGENMPFENESFDIVYARQVMHHAYHLQDFVKECTRVLKKGGIYFANRDHIVNDEKQLKEFLEIHPLHKYYGGENAFSEVQYKEAILKAGLSILKIYKHIDSVLLTDKSYPSYYFHEQMKRDWGNTLSAIPFAQKVYWYYQRKKNNDYSNIAGRVFAFICKKK